MFVENPLAYSFGPQKFDSVIVQPVTCHFLTEENSTPAQFVQGNGPIISSWLGENCCYETAGLARPCLLFARLILAFSARS